MINLFGDLYIYCYSCTFQSSGGCAAGMLAALVAEAGEAGGEAPVVFSDELAGAEGDAPPPHAPLRHALDDDNAHTACLSTYTQN